VSVPVRPGASVSRRGRTAIHEAARLEPEPRRTTRGRPWSPSAKPAVPTSATTRLAPQLVIRTVWVDFPIRRTRTGEAARATVHFVKLPAEPEALAQAVYDKLGREKALAVQQSLAKLLGLSEGR